MAVDATKLVKDIGIWNNHVVGKKAVAQDNVDSDQLIPIDDETTFWNTVHESNDCDKASEIKCAVITTQNPPDGASPMYLLSARPQSTNDSAEHYNNNLLHAVDHVPNCHLISIAFDGLSAESQFIYDTLMSFMHGKSNTVGLVDPNHAAKSMRGQLVLGSSIVSMGSGLVDPGYLKLCGISKDVYRVSDFASDGLVLKLCSSSTIEKLESLISEERHSLGITIFTLCFLRLFLVGVNAKDVTHEERVFLIWASLMWFTCAKGIHHTTLYNFVVSGMGAICLAIQNDIHNLRLFTSEPAEHFFGNARQFGAREFTVQGFLNFIEKLENVLKGIMMGLKSTTSSKGYMSGFKGFMDSIKRVTGQRKESQQEQRNDVGVEIDYNKPIADQIEPNILMVIQECQHEMMKLLRSMGVVDMTHKGSPLCSRIRSMSDLARIVATYAPSSTVQNSPTPVQPWEHCRDYSDVLDEDEIEADVQNLVQCEETLEALVRDIRNIDAIEEDSEIDVENCVHQIMQEHPNVLHVDTSELRKWMQPNACDVDLCSLALLTRMKGIMGKASSRGTSSTNQKVNSLQGRWFAKVDKNVDNSSSGQLKRNIVVKVDSKFYKITSVYLKSYNKWRIEDSVQVTDKAKVHLTKVRFKSERNIEVDDDCTIAEKYIIKKSSECSNMIGFITRQVPN